MTPDEWLARVTVGEVLLVLGIVGAVIAGVRKVWPILVGISHLVDDIRGESPRPGVPGRPGLMERLATVEHDARLAAHNTKPNGGGSSHDEIMRELKAIRQEQALHANALSEHIELSTSDRAELRDLVESNHEAITEVHEAVAESVADRKALHQRINRLNVPENTD